MLDKPLIFVAKGSIDTTNLDELRKIATVIVVNNINDIKRLD